jgi:hypothetical protein
MSGAARTVRAGTVLELPATLRTGRDGAIELKQGATSVSVGPDTQLEFPALEKRGAPVDRIVQPRGNAFYDIGKREGRKLRVETPYLVGVIKGTQFNVSAQADATTISLFEGSLEVRGANDGEAVDLRAGEIASRGRGDKSITVIKMNEKAPATAPVSQRQSDANGGGGSDTPAPPRRRETPDLASGDTGIHGHVVARPTLTVDDAAAGAGVNVSTRDVAHDADVNPASAAVDVDDDAGNGVPVDAAVVSSVVGPVGVDTDALASVDVGGGAVSVDAGVSAGVDVGSAASIDVGANTSIDLGSNGVGVDVAAAVDLAAGGVTTTIDTGAGVDLGSGGVSVDVGAGLAAGAGDIAAVDAGVDLAANLGAGAVDVDTAVDVGANVAGLDAGVSAGVNVGAGAIDLGLNVGGIDVNVGIDLGLDDGDNGNGNDPGGTDSSNPGTPPPPSTPGNIIEDVGGLLDGLLRRPGRR